MATTTASSGVATRLPASWTKKCVPAYSSRTGTTFLSSRTRDAGAGVEGVVLVLEQLVGAVEQDRGEDEQHGGEAADDGDAEREEDAAEDQGAHDAVEQHPVLVGARDLEVAEDQGEDEQVVDAQRLLEQPGRRVLDAGGGAEDGEDDATEGDGEADPEGAPPGGLPEADDVLAAVGEQVDQQGDHDGDGERRPQPERDVVHGVSSVQGDQCLSLQECPRRGPRPRSTVGPGPPRALPGVGNTGQCRRSGQPSSRAPTTAACRAKRPAGSDGSRPSRSWTRCNR